MKQWLIKTRLNLKLLFLDHPSKFGKGPITMNKNIAYKLLQITTKTLHGFNNFPICFIHLLCFDILTLNQSVKITHRSRFGC